MPDPRLSVRSANARPDEDGAPASIDEASIRSLVFSFYDKVRADALIGPVFEREVKQGMWPVHLEKMCDFWSSVLLRTGRYAGRPLAPHLRVPDLSDAHFERWLGLFRQTTREVFDEAGAAYVMAFASRIANSFRLSRAFHNGQDTTSLRPLQIVD